MKSFLQSLISTLKELKVFIIFKVESELKWNSICFKLNFIELPIVESVKEFPVPEVVAIFLPSSLLFYCYNDSRQVLCV